MCLFWRIGVYDGSDTFFEGVQAGRLDHGLYFLANIDESQTLEMLLKPAEICRLIILVKLLPIESYEML